MHAGKLPHLMGSGIWPGTETCVNWGGPIAMVLCLHKGNANIKRKLRVWRAQKCIPLVGTETPLTCVGWQTTPSHRGRCRAENGNLSKLGWTYRHGTVFAQRQCQYQTEATAMESPKMYSTSRDRNPTYLCGLANYPVTSGAV